MVSEYVLPEFTDSTMVSSDFLKYVNILIVKYEEFNIYKLLNLLSQYQKYKK